MGVRLPAGYQEVEYIEGTGTQWFNVGIYTDANTWVHAKLYTISTGNKNWFGAQYGLNRSFCLNSYSASQIEYSYGSRGWTRVNYSGAVGAILDLYFAKDSQITINGTVVASDLPEISGTSEWPLYIFRRAQGNAPVSGRIYLFDVYSGNDLVCSLIPCYRKSDDKPGMYDLVSGTFFTNAGTGEFLVGLDVIDSISPLMVAWRRIMMAAASVAKKLVKLIATSGTGLVSFDTNVEMPVKVTCEFSPIQDGTGDPSPDNVRPISGWTGANIYQLAGLPSGYTVADYVNIRDGFTIPTTIDFNAQDVEVFCTFRPVYYKQYASLYRVYANESAVATRIIFGSAIDNLLINNNSKASSPTRITIDSNVFNTIRNCYGKCYLNGQEISISTTAGNRTNSNFIVGQARSYWDIKGIAVYKNGAKLLNLIPCINSGGVSGFYESVSEQFYTTPNPSFATAYGNFSGIDYLNTYSIPINWQTEAGTVYGGTVTLNEDGSADLVSAWKYITPHMTGSYFLNGSVSSAMMLSNGLKAAKDYTGSSYLGSINDTISIELPGNYGSRRAVNDAITANGGYAIWERTLIVYDPDPTITKEAMVEKYKNMSICYPLKTPTTYHFDNIGQLQSFLGENNIWSDLNGSITAEYYNKQ